MTDDRYDRITWPDGGHTVDKLTAAALTECERRLGYSLTVVQGSYNAGGVGASAGTHDGGGAVDLLPWDWRNKVKVLREVGFAAWHRVPSQGPWSEHIHCILIGDEKMSPAAAQQVVAYRNGRNGLANNAVDKSWRPNPIPTFVYPTPTPPPAPKPKRKRKHLLRLESAPLHTESHEWASHAPAQAEASYQRGAHVIGFTEVTKAVAPQLEALATEYGYTFIHGDGDTALAIQSHLKTVRIDPFVRVAGERGYTSVTFWFHGNKVTVICQHWGTNQPSHHATRVAQTQALIAEMHHAANGRKLAFYMGDTNPDGPLSKPGTFPRADLDKAGFPLIYEALNTWPANIGVNAIGHARWDKRVQAKAVDTFDALGSDHIPALGVYVVTGRPPLLQRLLGR